MHKKTTLKFNSTKSVRPVSWLGLAVVSLVCSSLGFADVWLDQDYSAYTVGNQIGTNNTPSLLSSVPSNNIIVDVSGNKKLQYYKTATASGNGTLYKLSDNLSTDRPQGYFSFKGTIGTNVNGTSYLSYVLGANDSNSMSAAASTYLQIRLYNTNPTANQLRIYSGSGNASNPTQVWPTSGYLTLPASENSFQVWYNKTVNPMSYTNPTGVSNQVNPNSFVVYINGTLYGSNASSTGPLPPTVQSVTGTVTNNVATIGKLGWWGGSSSQPYDVTFDNVYAADSAPSLGSTPTITSPSNTAAFLNIPYSYQINTDPPGATSFAVTSGLLPNGLTLNTTNGQISGTPSELGGPTTVTLTASNSVGTGSSFLLSFTVSLPVNIFTGINTSLNTSTSWSLGSTPTASANPGSYTDLVFSSSATDLTTSSGNVIGKSWNVTNGNGYKFSSVATNVTTFKIGNNNPVSTPFYNSVAGSNNVLVYLVNGSSLTFSPSNTTTATPSSLASLYNSGTLQIGSGSILRFQAPLGENGGSFSVTKVGAGTLSLEAANTYSGGTIVSEGVVNATVANSLSAGTITVNGGELNVSGENAWVGSKALTLSGGRATFSASNNYTGVTTMSGGTLQLSNVAALGGSNTAGTFTLSGGTIEALVDYDLGHTWATSTTVGSITFDKLDGKTTTVNGPVTLNATSGATLSLYKLAGNTNSSSVVTKTGNGTLKLTGGTPSGGWIGNWQINAGTLFVNTTSSGALGSNNAVVMNGGNLLFSKGVGSSGTYSGHGQDTALSVQAEATITLDPNPLTPAGANTVSFTNLNIGTQTLHIAKGNSTKSSSTDVGYTDPQLSFRAASLTGQATLDVAANVETVMQAGSGSGGVTKSGAGLLTLSDGTTVTTTVVDSLTNSVTNTIVSSYTGPTYINAGTLALRGSHSSAITIGSSAALQLALVSSSSPTTTQGLTLTGGSKVRPVGTPTEASYTLVTASGGITGTPVLETPIDGYELVKSNDNKSLILQQSLQDGFSQYLMAQNLLPGTAFDEVVNGSKVGLQYTFGSPAGLPQNNGVAAVPVVSGNQLTYTFDVKDDSALTLTYQTSTDLVTWTTWLADKATTITGSSPAPDPGFLKKQVQFTGSGKLFIRINVTR
jgi:autotransporter-associated beta strand protein